MIRVIIVDDEEPAREELRYLLEQDLEIRVIAEACDGREALGRIESLQPEVVFLDVQMPDLDGFGVACSLMQSTIPPVIVFVTAYNQYAVEAFEHAALDYLLKPVAPSRLDQTLARVKKLLLAPRDTAWHKRLESFLENFGEIHYPSIFIPRDKIGPLERIPVKENEKVVLLSPEEIIFVESLGRGTQLTTALKVFCSDHTLNELEERLREHFFLRTHKSYLVNLKEIREVIPWFNNTLLLNFKGCQPQVPVSRTYLKEFKTRVQI